MQIKLFEVRDAMTFIPVIAVRFDPRVEAERYLLARAGYGLNAESQRRYVVLAPLAGGTGQLTCDPYKQTSMTLRAAHAHALDAWDQLASGDVIDVQFIRGETTFAKRSERFDAPC